MGRASHHFAWGKWRLFGAELLLATALSAALLRVAAPEGSRGPGAAWVTASWVGPLLVLALLWLALYAADLFETPVARRDRERGTRLLSALGAATVLLAGTEVLLKRQLPLSAGSLLECSGGLLVALALTRWQLPLLGRVSGATRRVALAGEREAVTQLADTIAADGDAVVEVVARLDPGDRELSSQLAWAGADTLVVCSRQRRGHMDMDALLQAALAGTEILEAPVFAERLLRRIPLDSLRPFHLIFGAIARPGPVESLLLRLLHVGGALVLVVLASPLLLLAALAVRLDSPGPIFYRQERVGLGGRRFTLFKFRTMRVDAEAAGPRWATVGDDRVTRVGRWLRRWRIDELPQLLNVLSGDMSLVGPRPERPEFVRRLKQVIPFYALRETVLPGLSGWAQVRCAYASTIEEQGLKLEHDLYYVRHRGLLLDLAVLGRTLKVVVLGRGAR